MPAAVEQRKTGGRSEFDRLWSLANAAVQAANIGPLGSAALANGGTAGNLATVAAIDYKIDGQLYTRAIVDDHWDLSAEADTIAAEFRAYWLYIDTSGAASFVAGANAASEALAIAALPTASLALCPVGVYVAGALTDFDDAGGLAAQGTIINGSPAALAPATVTLIHS